MHSVVSDANENTVHSSVKIS